MLVEIFCGIIFIGMCWVCAGEPDAKDTPKAFYDGVSGFVKNDIFGAFSQKE
jgi:hypothetical protein